MTVSSVRESARPPTSQMRIVVRLGYLRKTSENANDAVSQPSGVYGVATPRATCETLLALRIRRAFLASLSRGSMTHTALNIGGRSRAKMPVWQRTLRLAATG